MQCIRPRSGAQSAARNDVGGKPVASSVTFVAGMVATDRKFPMRRAYPTRPWVVPAGRGAMRGVCVPVSRQGEPKWNFRSGLSME
jgi:hypothetical protein